MADDAPGALRARALDAVDDALMRVIAKESETAWAKVAGGEQIEQAAAQFTAGLSRLFALRRRLRAELAAIVGTL